MFVIGRLKICVRGECLVAYKIVKSGDYRERRNFSRIRNTYELKDLLEIQKNHMKNLLMKVLRKSLMIYFQ